MKRIQSKYHQIEKYTLAKFLCHGVVKKKYAPHDGFKTLAFGCKDIN